MTWWTWALASTIFWGVFYVSVGRLVPTISPISMYWLPIIPLTIALPFYYQTVVNDFNTLFVAPTEIKIIAVVAAVSSIIASILFYKSIGLSNATQASLIQITYPIFVAFLAYAIFQENHINWSIISGGFLILVGSGIVIYNN